MAGRRTTCRPRPCARSPIWALVAKVPCRLARLLLANLQEVFLGTKLSVLFPAIPVAIVAKCYGFGEVSFLTSNDS